LIEVLAEFLKVNITFIFEDAPDHKTFLNKPREVMDEYIVILESNFYSNLNY